MPFIPLVDYLEPFIVSQDYFFHQKKENISKSEMCDKCDKICETKTHLIWTTRTIDYCSKWWWSSNVYACIVHKKDKEKINGSSMTYTRTHTYLKKDNIKTTLHKTHIMSLALYVVALLLNLVIKYEKELHEFWDLLLFLSIWGVKSGDFNEINSYFHDLILSSSYIKKFLQFLIVV